MQKVHGRQFYSQQLQKGAKTIVKRLNDYAVIFAAKRERKKISRLFSN